MSMELRHAPLDTITSLCFSPNHAKNILGCTSWDNHLRVYDVDAQDIISKFEFPSVPLGATFLKDFSSLCVGTLGGLVQMIDVHAHKNTQIGRHEGAVKDVKFHKPTSLLYSSGWDGSVRCWDIRAPRQVGIAHTHGKVFALDLNDEKLVACDSKKRTYIYDIRDGPHHLDTPEMRDQILKFQIRTVRCFPNGQGFAESSIEGRVAWEYFDSSAENQVKKYAFKCHRIKEADGTEIACPVNSIAFHPRYGTFATGGSDGGVCIWDGLGKKRLCRIPLLPTSVSSLAFNSNGTQLAVGVSYMQDKQVNSTPPKPQILVRAVNEDDVRPKSL